MGTCSDRNQLNRDNPQAKIQQNSINMADSRSSIIKFDSKCQGNYPITIMCISKTCQLDALACENQKCRFCTTRHQTCGQLKLQSVSSLIRQRQTQQNHFLKQIDQIQANIFHNLVQKRQTKFAKKQVKWGFDKKYFPIANKLIFGEKNIHFKGYLVQQFYQKLIESNTQLKQLESSIIHQLRYEIQNISVQLAELQAKAIKKYMEMCQVSDIKTQSHSRITDSNHFKLESAIIPLHQQENIISKSMQDIKFIYQSLDWPKELKLIYRASQHQFSAFQFHKICDNTANTLTLIMTEYGHIIAGYTPLTWNQTRGIAADHTGLSFLLSISDRKKMQLKCLDKAIQCLPDHGPVFGGKDLSISHFCNINQKSLAMYQDSYKQAETEQIAYQKSRKIIPLVSDSIQKMGLCSQKTFKIVQYEVYKVSWLF